MTKKLAVRNEQILAHMLAGRSITCIARLMNVHRDTIYHWVKSDEFVALHEQAKTELLDAVVDSFTAGSFEAVAVLRAAVNDSRLAPADRIEAARYFAEVGRDFIKARDDKKAANAAKPWSELTDAEKVLRLEAEQKEWDVLEARKKRKS